MRISDWSSDVCSSDLASGGGRHRGARRRDGGECGRGLSRHQAGGQFVIPPAVPARAIDAPNFSTSRFRAEREADWIAFDLLPTKIEKTGLKALPSDELPPSPLTFRPPQSSPRSKDWLVGS